MHEIAIVHSLIEMAQQHARRVGARRIRRLACRIGVLRQVDGGLLRDVFAVARAGTLCDGAELDVETVVPRLYCPRCKNRFELREWNWNCPDCGMEGKEPICGDELDLCSIEVEVDDDDPGGSENPGRERECRTGKP